MIQIGYRLNQLSQPDKQALLNTFSMVILSFNQIEIFCEFIGNIPRRKKTLYGHQIIAELRLFQNFTKCEECNFNTAGTQLTSDVLTVGLRTQTIHCWRPLGRSHVSEMRRFFIGGSPELEDPTFVASPSAFEVSFSENLSALVSSSYRQV